MNSGVYGTRIGANVSTNDIDIFYNFRPTRNVDGDENAIFHRLPSKILTQVKADKDDEMLDDSLEGMYNLRLPLQYFNRKGFYTVYIKPKEIPVVLADVSVLAAYTDVRGLVIDTSKVSDATVRSMLQTNNSLVGYRVAYFNELGKRENYYRLITSNNKCEPIVQAVSDTSQKSVRYRYNDSSTLIFCTVTPSSSLSFKTNTEPYIGVPTQQVALINTKFEPVMVEIEMTEHDIETVSTMLEGTQLRSLDNGLVTTFNNDGDIYAQHEHYSLKDEYTGQPIYEVKKNRMNNIDFSQTMQGKE